jgi:hypothetical protein
MAKVMIKIAKGSDPKVPVSGDFDIRDALTALVGKGNMLSPDDKAGIYGSLITKLGKDKAQKVMDHAYIFNSRPETQRMPVEDRLRSFYTVGSNDPDVQGLIEKSKSLGYGILPGFRGSNNALNQELSGQVAAVAPAAVNPEVQRKIMLQVRK